MIKGQDDLITIYGHSIVDRTAMHYILTVDHTAGRNDQTISHTYLLPWVYPIAAEIYCQSGRSIR